LYKIIEHNTMILFDILELYGFREEKGDRVKVIEYYTFLTNALSGDWVKVYKYKLSAFFAVWRKNPEVPPCPFPPPVKDNASFLMGGRPGRYIKGILDGTFPVIEEIDRDGLLDSLYQAKKGMKRPEDEYKFAKEEEFFETLTAPQPEGKEWGEDAEQSLLSEEIRRTVREVFGHMYIKNTSKSARRLINSMTRAVFPSTSANYINSRSNGGCVTALLEHPEIQELRRPGGYLKEDKEERRENYDNDHTPHYDLSDYNIAVSHLWARCTRLAKEEPNHAVPVALPEALKWRVITKGPPFKMFSLTNIQQMLHAVLRKHPAFKLVGSPTGGEATLAEYLEKRLKTKTTPWKQGEVFHSGDYKAATDNFKSWASRVCADEISNVLGLPPSMRKLLTDSLSEYYIELKNRKGKTIKIAKQTKGQLMGSIVSFPVLCLVNAAVTRRAYEEGASTAQGVVRMSLEDCPIAINGDDVAGRTNQVGVASWKYYIPFVGLEESIGKTLYSEDFVQVNSTDFIARTNAKGEKELTEIPYVNMGLVSGLKRSGGQASLYDYGEYTFGARYRELMKKTPTHLRDKVHRLFIKYNKKSLSSIRLPWYIPEWMGGLGLTGHAKPSELDLRIAQKILFEWKERRPHSLGATPTEWKIWELATERAPKPFVVKTENPGVKAYEHVLHLHAIDILFDSDVTMDAIRDVTGDEGRFITLKIRHNEKLWKPTKEMGKLPKPIENERLEFERRYLSLQGEKPYNLNTHLNTLEEENFVATKERMTPEVELAPQIVSEVSTEPAVVVIDDSTDGWGPTNPLQEREAKIYDVFEQKHDEDLTVYAPSVRTREGPNRHHNQASKVAAQRQRDAKRRLSGMSWREREEMAMRQVIDWNSQY